MSTSETFNLDVIDPGPAPTISKATVSTKHGFTITLTFSQPLDQATALDASNYVLVDPGEGRSASTTRAPRRNPRRFA